MRKLKPLTHYVDIEGVDVTLLSDTLKSIGLEEYVSGRINTESYSFTLEIYLIGRSYNLGSWSTLSFLSGDKSHQMSE